jgi:hypothetical protein
MKALDDSEVRVLEWAAGPCGTPSSEQLGICLSAEGRMFRRGLIFIAGECPHQADSVHVELTSLGREALRIARAVRALEDRS